VLDVREQDAENNRYWQGRSVRERLVLVCELSESAYAFAAGFPKKAPFDEVQGSVIFREDLIRNKLAVARDQDQVGVESLRVAKKSPRPGERFD
jgi:hypothetical protein